MGLADYFPYALEICVELANYSKNGIFRVTEWEGDFLQDNIYSPLLDKDISPTDLPLSSKQRRVVIDIATKYERSLEKFRKP